ncbi:MAG: hypothetical protein NVS4B2_32140 [Chloroflexota bacterium]
MTLLFFSLERIDAALSSLLFYSYPALVTVGAILVRRELATWRRSIVLVVLTSIVMVFSTAADARRDSTGVLLSLVSALVPTGAAVTFVLGGTLLRCVSVCNPSHVPKKGSPLGGNTSSTIGSVNVIRYYLAALSHHRRGVIVIRVG